MKGRTKAKTRYATNEVLRAEFGMCSGNNIVRQQGKELRDSGKISSVICLNYALNFDNRKCLVCSLAYEIEKKKRSKLWSSLTSSNLVSYCDRQLYWQRTGHN